MWLGQGLVLLKYNKSGDPIFLSKISNDSPGAQWLSGRVLDSRPKGRGFEPHRRHCVVSLSKNINPSLVLVQPRKTRPFITERLLMGRKESNQTKNQMIFHEVKTKNMILRSDFLFWENYNIYHEVF